MANLKIIIEVVINADPSDDEEVREAVYEFLTAKMEAEELEFQIDEEEEDDET